MLPLCGKTVLEVMLERLSSFKKNIIIATTNDGTQKPIVELCQQLDINFFEGDMDNVLSRYYQAALSYQLKNDDIIVRCTSDCPLIDSDVIQLAVSYYEEYGYDYVIANSSTGFPRGLDVEVFNFALLEEASSNATQDYEKEHVTPYIYKSNPNKFKIGQLKSIKDASKYRITLDELADYRVIQEIYKQFSCKTRFKYDELVSMLDKNPYIYDINKAIEQKKLKT